MYFEHRCTLEDMCVLGKFEDTKEVIKSC